MKRPNLEQEAQVVGNYYRDVIRSYGIDVVYNKRDTSMLENYKQTIDHNTFLQKAYGYEMAPDYSCSAHMISYMEVEQDIFQLNKYGLNPNADVSFYFDSTDFACALATKLGQYEEHKIKEIEFECEVPECTDEVVVERNPVTGEFITSAYVSADVFPYQLGLGRNEEYYCEMLSGKLSVEIPGYEFDKEYTVPCHPYEHSDFNVEFPANKSLYRSLKHRYQNDDYLQTLVFLTFKVSKVVIGKDNNGKKIHKCILHGKIHGAVLFYNMFKIGKYLEKIHPEVGDLITIDFPDERNSERYQVTDCYDKSLQSDGISPLLHKYIWKCKGRRYANTYDDIEMNEADKKLLEKQQFEQVVEEQVTSQVSKYEDNEDAAYGGYEGNMVDYEKDIVHPHRDLKVDYVDDGTGIDIHQFACGSKLVTTGYELFYVNARGEAISLTLDSTRKTAFPKVVDSGLRYLKASADCLVFVDFDGQSHKIVEDVEATQGELQICLNSLFDRSIDDNVINANGNCFYVFKESKTMLWATEEHLYCKLASNGRLYRLA